MAMNLVICSDNLYFYLKTLKYENTNYSLVSSYNASRDLTIYKGCLVLQGLLYKVTFLNVKNHKNYLVTKEITR